MATFLVLCLATFFVVSKGAENSNATAGPTLLASNAGDDEKWEKYGDVAEKGKSVIVDVVKTATDPNLKSVGELLEAVAPFATMSGGPAGLVVGSVLGLTGGLLGLSDEDGPSNQDILNAMKKGFEEVQGKLDKMEKTLDDMQDAVSLINQDVVAIYEQVKMQSFNAISSIFQEAMLRLKSAMNNGQSEVVSDFLNYVQEERNHVSEVKSNFDPGNVESIVQTLIANAHGNTCGVLGSLLSIVGARHQYFWIMLVGSVMRPCPKGKSCFSPTVVEYAKSFRNDLQAYAELARRSFPKQVLEASPTWRREHSSDREFKVYLEGTCGGGGDNIVVFPNGVPLNWQTIPQGPPIGGYDEEGERKKQIAEILASGYENPSSPAMCQGGSKQACKCSGLTSATCEFDFRPDAELDCWDPTNCVVSLSQASASVLGQSQGNVFRSTCFQIPTLQQIIQV
eukprot:TRINITY_DN7538_c0_g3_i1.p1 TRINITY_DN7538_c0_g3~~TRINITY_DN7538_c0_g3_i1.p1  ORF type:complete len:453 (+),score=82.26 TRINITY_DN7538_c0_g3_i1:76-1434(+)